MQLTRTVSQSSSKSLHKNSLGAVEILHQYVQKTGTQNAVQKVVIGLGYSAHKTSTMR